MSSSSSSSPFLDREKTGSGSHPVALLSPHAKHPIGSPVVTTGIIAFVGLAMVNFTSIRFIRAAAYEVFLIAHVLFIL